MKIKVASDTCFVIQLQGNRYCHGIEKKSIYNEINNDNTLAEIPFLIFFGKGIDNKMICHYGNDFVYNYQKVTDETIGELLNKINDDIIEILRTVTH